MRASYATAHSKPACTETHEPVPNPSGDETPGAVPDALSSYSETPAPLAFTIGYSSGSIGSHGLGHGHAIAYFHADQLSALYHSHPGFTGNEGRRIEADGLRNFHR